MRERLRCRLGFHRWMRKYDDEKSAEFKECSLCGKTRGTGWPPV